MNVILRAAGALAVLTALSAANGLQAQTGPAAPTAPVTKIGFINSQKIIASAPGRDEAEAQFRKEMAGYQAQVQKLQDSLKTIIDTYTKQEPTMSAVARDGKQREIQAKEADYQNRVRQLETQAQQREGELVRPIMDQINKIIEAMRAEDGYSMIFDVASNGGSVVAADPALELTDRVIARLKAAAPAAPTKPVGSPVPTPSGVKTPPKKP